MKIADRTLAWAVEEHNLIFVNDRLSTILLPPEARRSIIDLILANLNIHSLHDER